MTDEEKHDRPARRPSRRRPAPSDESLTDEGGATGRDGEDSDTDEGERGWFGIGRRGRRRPAGRRGRSSLPPADVAPEPPAPLAPVDLSPDARQSWDIPLDAVDMTWDARVKRDGDSAAGGHDEDFVRGVLYPNAAKIGNVNDEPMPDREEETPKYERKPRRGRKREPDAGRRGARPASPESRLEAPEPEAPEPEAPEPVAPEPVAPEPVAPEPTVPEPVTPEPVTPEPIVPEPAMTAPASSMEPPEREAPTQTEPETPREREARLRGEALEAKSWETPAPPAEEPAAWPTPAEGLGAQPGPEAESTGELPTVPVSAETTGVLPAAGEPGETSPLFGEEAWEELKNAQMLPTAPLPLFEGVEKGAAAAGLGASVSAAGATAAESGPAAGALAAAGAAAASAPPAAPLLSELGLPRPTTAPADFMGEGAPRPLPKVVMPPKTTSIADLARAHEEASIEQSIAQDIEKKADSRRLILVVAGMVLVGALIGGGVGLWAVSRQQHNSAAAPKVGLQPGVGGPLAVIPTTTPEPTSSAAIATATGAQVGVIILGLGEGSSETSANLDKFAQQRLPLTYGIYPQRAGTAKDAAVVQASGGQSMVYQPVGGPGTKTQNRRGEITPDQSLRQIANTITRNTSGISANAGIAPYGFTKGDYPARPLRILPVMGLRQNVFMFESVEGTGLPLSFAARRVGAKYLGTDILLDSKDDEKAFKARWDAALKLAEKNNRVVVVCRLSTLTARVLPPLLAAIDTNKYTLTLASSMAQ